MAALNEGIFDKCIKNEINNCKILVVGAGGIGCELLKTLVLTGFEDIHVIDLDTIELSNLNRQFLFHKQHIGKPKAVVAKESVLKLNPKAKIVAYHDSITNSKYNVEFYRQFRVVANALDNIGARSHVNRMCMSADVPLVESGSAGYLGQCTMYKKKETECYECLPRKPQKTYPGCTIRNTPSEPVHCIVWAKHLFNQLFGESDADDEVSPDVNDPELAGKKVVEDNGIEKFSTREWAKSTGYDAQQLFQKLFNEDIKYLMKMNDLWKSRKCPTPLEWESLSDAVPGSSCQQDSGIKDQIKWSLQECRNVFQDSLISLRKRIEEEGTHSLLTWDKDDDISLDFVASCANLRAACFYINQLTRFEIKSIAGNIIPAIATTNAIIGGLVVLQVLKILKGNINACKNMWLNESYEPTGKLISSAQLETPNPKCVVCSSQTPEVKIKLNINSLSIKTLNEKVLKEKLHVVQPDVVINDGSGTILISSDPDDMSDDMFEKSLSNFKLETEARLLCEDFLQNFKILLIIIHDESLVGQEFVFESDIDDLKLKEQNTENDSAKENKDNESHEIDSDMELDIEICEPENMTLTIDDENGMEPPAKKLKQ